jgi:hypothetical protein
LLSQQQEQRLVEQGEPREPTGEFRLDQPNRAIGQTHPWGAYLKVALVLEEVQMPIVLDDRVMHRMQAVMAGQRRTGAPGEVNP